MKNIIIHIFCLLFFAGLINISSPVLASTQSIDKAQLQKQAAAATQTAKMQSSIEFDFQTPDQQQNTPWDFLFQNWGVLSLSLLTFLEVVVRLTPTEKDNSIFKILNTIISALIPNLKKGGGKF